MTNLNTNVATNLNTVTALTAKELLLDWVSGQGASGKTPETWEHVKDGMLHGKSVSLSLLTAVAEMRCTGTPVSFDTAIERGYLSSNHQTQHEGGRSKTDQADVLVTTKAVLTSEEYLTNAIKLGLDNKNLTAISDAVLEFYKLTDKTTKADLVALLTQVIDCFVPEDKYTVYKIKATDEQEAAIKFQSLIDAGFIDIRTTTKDNYVANLHILDLSSLGLLSGLEYSLVNTKPLSETLHQVIFKAIDSK